MQCVIPRGGSALPSLLGAVTFQPSAQAPCCCMGAICGALDVNDLEFWGLGCWPRGAEGCGLVMPGSVLSGGTNWLQGSNFSKFFSCHSWATVKNHTEMGKCWYDSEEENRTRVNHVANIKGIKAVLTWLWCGRGLNFLIFCLEATQP